MTYRFWIAPPLTPGQHELSDSEAHHARTVLRLSPGAVVEVFDGQGASGQAQLIDVSKRRVTLEISRVSAATTRNFPIITLATAVPKGDRFDWLIEKATELGAARIIPLSTERSSVEPRETKLDRIRQLSLTACKQCGRNTLLQVEPLTTFSELLQSFASSLSDSGARQLLFSDFGGQWLPQIFPEKRLAATSPVELVGLIGPEGGWSDTERKLVLAAGATPITLARHILRTETAAVALLSQLLTFTVPAAISTSTP